MLKLWLVGYFYKLHLFMFGLYLCQFYNSIVFYCYSYPSIARKIELAKHLIEVFRDMADSDGSYVGIFSLFQLEQDVLTIFYLKFFPFFSCLIKSHNKYMLFYTRNRFISNLVLNTPKVKKTFRTRRK